MIWVAGPIMDLDFTLVMQVILPILIPLGFDGTWEVVEPARKLYAIVTPD